jgi:hypothetical protein
MARCKQEFQDSADLNRLDAETEWREMRIPFNSGPEQYFDLLRLG